MSSEVTNKKQIQYLRRMAQENNTAHNVLVWCSLSVLIKLLEDEDVPARTPRTSAGLDWIWELAVYHAGVNATS